MAGRPEHKFDNSQLHERTALAEMLNTKIITPSKDEVFENPREVSARCECCENYEPGL